MAFAFGVLVRFFDAHLLRVVGPAGGCEEGFGELMTDEFLKGDGKIMGIMGLWNG